MRVIGIHERQEEEEDGGRSVCIPLFSTAEVNRRKARVRDFFGLCVKIINDGERKMYERSRGRKR